MAGITVFQAGAVTPTVRNWVDRIKTNVDGIFPSGSTVMAATRFHKNILYAGLVDKIYACNFFAPESLSASFTPFIRNGGFLMWSGSLNWSASDISVNGLQGSVAGSGNFVGKYLKTGITGSNVCTIQSSHLVAYASGSASIGANLGAATVGTAQYRLFTKYPIGSGVTQSLYYAATGTNTLGTASIANFNGFFLGTGNWGVPNQFTMSIFQGNQTNNLPLSLAGSSSVDTGTITANELTVFAGIDPGPTAGTKVPHIMSFVSMGTGLTATQSLAYYNAVVQLRKEIGGGYY